MIKYVISYAFAAISALAVVLSTLQFVHILQLESYQGKMYLKWFAKHWSSAWLSFLAAAAAGLMLKCCYVFFYGFSPVLASVCYTAGDVVYVLLLFAVWLGYRKRDKVKPLAFTGRVKRLLAAELILAALCSLTFFVTVVYTNGISWLGYILPQLVRFLPGILAPLFVFLCYLITWPVEEAIKSWYLNDAKKKLLSNDNLIRIGVTGSYGKTGTKYALDKMLQKKYSTLMTPGSFNTPMGVTRVVREKLEPSHEAFIAEMGARYTKDIKELCALVHPKYGIITAIGKQHLETFRTEENIIKTKSDLLRAIPEDGACFLNGDDANCRAVYDAYGKDNAFLYGTEGDGLFMRADDIVSTPDGSTFTLRLSDGTSVECKTRLLGKYNIINFTGAAAAAYYLGVGLDDIAEAIAQAEPVEHRLQLIPGRITVIDDAFNANPAGAKEALNVLSSFPGKRIIVTPGMVELGCEEAALNREFGSSIANAADIAIVIGKSHADPICEGLLASGFSEDKLIRVASLEEATAILPEFTEAGCTVLFENDLPDNYS